MKHAVLLGDSIFDNAPYVGAGESVIEILSSKLATPDKASLLAVDGDVTTDVLSQLSRFPADGTDVFLSCGGNDALRNAPVLWQSVTTVSEALTVLNQLVTHFRADYIRTLNKILDLTDRLTVCTIYNRIPELSPDSLTALALFNEVILEEAVRLKVNVMDLRITCSDKQDYSPMSPIEPSGIGAEKIAEVIRRVVYGDSQSSLSTAVYI